MSGFTMLAIDQATSELIGVWVAALLTICILSFLYKDNPLYKFAEHVMVGLAMGFFTIYYMFQVLEPQWWDRLVENELGVNDTVFGSTAAFRFALIIPTAFGVMMILRVVPKVAWISRWTIALMIGIASGAQLPWTIQGKITTQLEIGSSLPVEYMEALYGATFGFTKVPAWEVGVPIVIVGTVCALIYFFFSVPHRGAIGQMARAGIWVLMVGFGASFGYTVMARLSLLIGRVQFLLTDWLDVLPK
jgi:hypothetical protein